MGLGKKLKKFVRKPGKVLSCVAGLSMLPFSPLGKAIQSVLNPAIQLHQASKMIQSQISHTEQSYISPMNSFINHSIPQNLEVMNDSFSHFKIPEKRNLSIHSDNSKLYLNGNVNNFNNFKKTTNNEYKHAFNGFNSQKSTLNSKHDLNNNNNFNNHNKLSSSFLRPDLKSQVMQFNNDPDSINRAQQFFSSAKKEYQTYLNYSSSNRTFKNDSYLNKMKKY